MRLFKNRKNWEELYKQSQNKLIENQNDYEEKEKRLKEEIELLRSEIYKTRRNAKESIHAIKKESEMILEILKKDKEDIEEQNRNLNSSRGGLIAENNRLKKYIEKLEKGLTEELEKKISKSISDKYLFKKIPCGRTPNTTKMHYKSSAKTSRIAKQMHECGEE